MTRLGITRSKRIGMVPLQPECTEKEDLRGARKNAGAGRAGGTSHRRGWFFDAISVLLIEGDDGFTLVDTGLGSSTGRIQVALAALGGKPEDMRRVYITHHHLDHIGSLPGTL
jgi:glyoxylase-like metal-dependent hydrolase (beta-lactamase superfamily II)